MGKRLFLLILGSLFVFSQSSFAQQPTEQTKWFYIYAYITFDGVIRIDRGDGKSANKPNSYLVLNEGNNKFNPGSRIAGLNYMSEKGWEATILEVGVRDYFIMRKPTADFNKETIDKLFDNLKLKQE